LQPPPSAEDEVWRRLRTTLAAGSAAGATVTYAAASGGTKLLGKATWVTLLKWGAVLAVGVPAVTMTTRAVLSHTVQASASAVSAARPSSPVLPTPPVQTEAAALPTIVPEPPATPAEAPKAAAPPPHVARTPAAVMGSLNTSSALRAESELLGVARSRLAAGDYRGALQDVGRLQTRFPRGRLLQEREVVAIDSLAAMGDRPGARERAVAFIQGFPASPYSAHVHHVVEQ
jgi:hypothetical protein